MASEVIAFPVNLRKNKNQYSTAYGKYFPEADSKDPLSLKGFAKHLEEHGKLVNYPMAVLVLQNIVSCMKELVTQGQSVKLDGLGIFYPTIEATKGGAESVEEAVSNLTNLIEGVHLRFQPEGTKDDKLTSRALKDMCVFEAHDLVKTKYKTIDGKRKSYQERTPLATYGIATAEEDQPEP
jgi:nucleoid DNA-binding protein